MFLGLLLAVGTLVSGWLMMAPVFAQSVNRIGVSLSLYDTSYKPIKNGSYEVRFAIYTKDRTSVDAYPSNSDARVWEETQTVEVKNGILSAMLGGSSSFPTSLFSSDSDYYLGVRIGKDSEMTPRKRMSAVPFALNAQYLQGATIGEAEGDIPVLSKGGKFLKKYFSFGNGDGDFLAGNDSRLSDIHSQNTDTGTSETDFNIGSGSSLSSSNFTLSVSDASVKPALRYNATTSAWEFSNDGSTYQSIGDIGNYVATITAGNGISGSSTTEGGTPTLSVNVLDATDGSGATSSYSGLEFSGVGGNQLSLLQGCSNGQGISFNTATKVWECTSFSTGIAGTGTAGYATYWSGVNSLGSEQYLGVSRGGTGVNGSAAANGSLLIGNGSGYSLATLTSGSGITVTPGAGSITIASTLGASVDLTSEVTGILPIGNGGTGRASYTDGDMLYYSSGSFSVVPAGSNGQIFGWVGSAPTWQNSPFVGAHNLLSLSHPDTVAASPLPGDLVTGANILGVNKWTRFGVGSAGQFLSNDGTNLAWRNTSTITALGTITSGVWNGTSIDVAYGGTGLNASGVTDGQLLIGNDTGNGFTLAALTQGAGIVISNGAGTISIASILGASVDLTTEVTGILPIANGGTGASSLTDLIALGTHTTGDYVGSITAGNGIASTGAASGENISHTLSLGNLASDWNQTGAFDISLNNASSELKILESAGATFFGTIDVGDLGANATYTFSGTSGTVALGTGATNQVAYWTGTNTLAGENQLSVSRGGTGEGSEVNLENKIEGYIFDADTESITGVWSVADNVAFQYGTAGNYLTLYNSVSGDLEFTDGSNLLASLHDAGTVGNLYVAGGISTFDTTTTAGYGEFTGLCLGNGTNCITSWSGAGAIGGSGSAGYATYWSNSNTLTAEPQLATSRGGTGIDTSSSTGVATISSGAWNIVSALSVALGGTGAGTFTTNGVLYGNAGGTLQVTAAGTDAQFLVANVSGVPTFVSLSNDASISNTGALTISADAVALTTDTTGNYVATITAGNGISGSSTAEGGTPTIAVNILGSADGTGSISSNSGFEFAGASSNELALLQGCSNGQGISWNDGTSVWECTTFSSGLGGTGTSGYATYWSGTGSLGSEQYLSVARGGTGLSGSSAGNGTLLIGNGTGYSLANITSTGSSITITNGAGTINLESSLGTSVDLTTEVTGILPLANGGTNKNMTASNGGIVYSDADSLELSAVGTSGQALISGGAGAPTWFAPTTGSILFAGTSGILQQDNANFFFDNATNRLGLGTAAPSTLLELSGSGADVVSTITAADATYDPILKFRTGASPAVQFSLGVDNTDSGKFKIYSGDGLGSGDEFTIDASGVTSIANLNLGATSFDTDGGILSWVDMPVTSSASAGTIESYTAQIDGNSLLTVYAESDGAGSIQNSGVSIGNSTLQTGARFAVTQSSTSTTASSTLYGTYNSIIDTGIVAATGDDTYGSYTTVTRTGGTVGTFNTYGNYITVTGDTGGTSTATGLSVNVTGADTNYAAIFNGGNVGIGTATPTARLHVYGNNGTDDIGALIQNGSSSGGADAGLTIQTAGSNGDSTVQFYSVGQQYWTVGMDGASSNAFKINPDGNLTGSSKFVITPAGNVGIGDATPAALFTVGAADLFQVNSSGAIAAATGITSSGTITFSGLSTAGIVTNTAGGVLGTTGTVGVALGGTGTSTAFTLGSIVFAGASGVYTQDNANFFFDDTNNRLGLGTTTPGSMLDLFGTSNALRLSYDVSNYNTISTTSTGELSLASSNVSEAAVVIGTGSASQDVSVQYDSQTNDYFAGVDITTGNFMIGSGFTVQAASAFLNITSGGLVGINMTPVARFDITQSSTSTTGATEYGYRNTLSDTGIVTTGTDTTYGNYTSVTRTGASGGTINNYGEYITLTGDTGGTSTNTGLSVTVSGADTNYAAIFNGGNVGIGTSTPDASLDIVGTVEATRFELQGTASGWAALGGTQWYLSGVTVPITLGGNGVQVDDGGAIGWADDVTATMQTKLYEDADYIIAQRSGTAAQEYRIYNTDNGADDEFASLGFLNNTNVFTIETEKTGTGVLRNIALMGGNVGIGTTAPSSLLSIYGAGADVVSTITAADATYDPILKFRTGASPTVQFSLGVDNTDSDKFKIYSGDGLGSGDEFTIDASGVTSIANLNLGATSFDTDAGAVTWIDMPVTSSASAGTIESYSAKIDENDLLTIYAESDGAGSIQNSAVGIGLAIPIAKLDIVQSSTSATASSTYYGLRATVTDSGVVVSGTDRDYGTYTSLTRTGATATSGTVYTYGNYAELSHTGASSGTVNAYGSYVTATGDTGGTSTLYGSYINAVGADTTYGLYANVTGTTASTSYGIMTNLADTTTGANTNYGSRLTLSDTGIVTTGTDTTYGNYMGVTRTGASGGTINTYGQYITLTGDTGGTSNNTGLYVSVAGADTNYAAVFANGYVGMGYATPTARLDISGDVTMATASAEMITSATDRDFTGSIGNWTTGTNWAYGTNNAAHTAGTTGTLSLANGNLSATPVSGSVYQITFTVTTTTVGTIQLSFGSTASATILGQATGTITAETEVIMAAGSGALTFTPDVNWAGTIDDVSVKLITPSNPTQIVRNSDNTIGLEFRSGGTGLSNLFVGTNAGKLATTGGQNVALGYGALSANTTGTQNIAIGYNTLSRNTTGVRNIASGYQALDENTIGNYNVATGYQALGANVSGDSAVAYGYSSLQSNKTGDLNAAFGALSLRDNTTGGNNTASGYGSLTWNISGSFNTASGSYALNDNTTASNNTGFGWGAVRYNQTGSNNTAVGTAAGQGVSTNSYSNNALFGYRAGYVLTTGSNNILIGSQSGDAISSGSNNIMLGYSIDAPSPTGSNQLSIGNLIFGTGIDGTGTTVSTGSIGIGDASPDARLDIDSTQTSGTLFGMAAPSSVTLAGTLIGASIDLSTNYTATGRSVTGVATTLPTVTNTGAGTYDYQGMTITGNAIIQNTGAGVDTFSGVAVTNPNITQTTGTIVANGLKVTTGSITTGGTQNGLNITATGVGAGTLNGINISGITAGAGTENAITIGTGWDKILETGSIDISGTGAITGATDITATGQINGADGMVTKVNAGACDDTIFTLDTDGNTCVDSSNGRFYFRYGGAWHYAAQTAGFQIPNYEAYSYDFASHSFDTEKPLLADDFLMPFVERGLEDGAVHGLYAKFSDVKDTLLADEHAQITAINLKTDANALTIGELQTSIDTQLAVAGDAITALQVAGEAMDANQTILRTDLDSVDARVAILENDANAEALKVATLQSEMTTLKEQVTTLTDFYTALDLSNVVVKDLAGNVDLSGSQVTVGTLSADGLSITVTDVDAPTIGTAEILPVAADADLDGNDDYTDLPMTDPEVIARDGKFVQVLTKAMIPMVNGSRIFTTFKGNPNGFNWVEKVKDSDGDFIGFKIRLSEAITAPIKVDWLLVEQK